MRICGGGEEISYRCRRRLPGPRTAASDVRVSIGDPYAPADLGKLDHFLTARWILFSVSGTRYWMARACHDPWPLHHARVHHLDDRLVAAAGLPAPASAPLVHYSPGVAVAVGEPERGG